MKKTFKKTLLVLMISAIATVSLQADNSKLSLISLEDKRANISNNILDKIDNNLVEILGTFEPFLRYGYLAIVFLLSIISPMIGK